MAARAQAKYNMAGQRQQRQQVYARNAYRGAGGYYIDGNTVRVAEPVREPARRVRRPAAPAPQLKPRYMEAERTASVSIPLGMSLMLMAAVIAALFIGYRYITLKSSLEIHVRDIRVLESRLETLINDNDAIERSIDTSVDLNYVYDVAVNRLGMIQAGRNNIISYEKTESEYVRQYEDIPAAN